MSKIAIISILLLSLLPIAAFLINNNETNISTPTPDKKETAELEASSSPQCALCSQIETEESKQQCMKDFACS